RSMVDEFNLMRATRDISAPKSRSAGELNRPSQGCREVWRSGSASTTRHVASLESRAGETDAAAGAHRGLGSVAGSSLRWPLAARAQQPALPVVGFIVGSPDAFARYAAAFRAGLREMGYVDRHNVSIEYHWLEGQYDRWRASVAELACRRVA